jgi:hypothetical protein
VGTTAQAQESTIAQLEDLAIAITQLATLHHRTPATVAT